MLRKRQELVTTMYAKLTYDIYVLTLIREESIAGKCKTIPSDKYSKYPNIRKRPLYQHVELCFFYHDILGNVWMSRRHTL